MSKDNEEVFDRTGIKDIGFYRGGNEPFKISVPNLTIKEINWLDSVIHDVKIDEDDNITYGFKTGKAPALDADDVRMYKQIYRYFPTFAEAIL